MERRTKIICTLGPAIDAEAGLESLVAAGMDVARLNFSHGTHEEHAARFHALRRSADGAGRAVAILGDLCGPKIRTGTFGGELPQAECGAEVVLVEASATKYPEIGIQHERFASCLRAGDRVLLDDGRIGLRVTEVRADSARAVVEVAGRLRDRVGVHLPARSLHGGALTDKDRTDLAFGLALGIDYLAVSFVRTAADLHEVRQLCREHGRAVPLVSKIETPPAVDDIEAVVEASDAVMVARGDLGVEFSPEAVPVLQRRIIRAARRARRPVIVATEMLQSMVQGTRPTRAEASDVANAVFDGTDAVMLSAETATGAHPALAVTMMARIVTAAEQSLAGEPARAGTAARASIGESIAFNAADIADEIGARAIVAFTSSGATGRLVSQARPGMPLVALSPRPEVCRQMALWWGVVPLAADDLEHPDAMVDLANRVLTERGVISAGDLFVTVFGAPVGFGSTTNSIRVRVAD